MFNKRSVFTLQWHITNNCDQRCRHCYIFNANEFDDKELSLEECYKVINNFAHFTNSINCDPAYILTGGDPLLYPHIWEVLKYISKNNYRFFILGNPFHLNEEVCQYLKKLGCKSYQLSLDGLEKTHDNMRKKGSFEETIKAIELLKKNGIRVHIMSTISKLNCLEIPELVKFLVKKEIDSFAFGRYCPQNSDVETIFSPLEYKDFLQQMWEVYLENIDSKTKFSLKDHLWTLFLYEKGLFEKREEDIIFEGCNCAISHMCLLPNGTVYACRRFESPVGNILKSSFTNIFKSNNMEYYRQYEKFEECSDCELLNYCRGCPAVAVSYNGNFYSKDPQCWKNCS